MGIRGRFLSLRALAMHTSMTNQWLKDKELLSVKERWVKIHYPNLA